MKNFEHGVELAMVSYFKIIVNIDGCKALEQRIIWGLL
jgi:hypothetical protein